MSRDSSREGIVQPRSADADAGSAETVGSVGTRESPHGSGESPLRARIEARIAGGETVRIGRFEVIDLIGAGGMSVVCRARDPDLDREVAIKLLHGPAAPGDQARARLQREARAMAKLSHPNVATVFEVGMHEGEVFVAMELVAGQTLRAWRVGHASDQRGILAKYLAAGEGLAAAHAAGFVHRDFKPDNVMVGIDGRVRVLDFGLAAVFGESIATHAEEISGDRQGELTMTGALLGTPVYMAPEQHRGGIVDARTDQFAFCVALWEALVGERPFAGATLYEVAATVCLGTIRSPTRPLPAHVEPILRRGLAVAPTERFPSMRDLLGALAAATHPPRRATWFAATIVSGVLGIGAVVLVARDTGEPTAIAARGAPAPARAASAVMVELTRTPERGIDPFPLFMDRDARRVVYRVGGELWVRDVTRPRPEPLDWGRPELEPIAFVDDGIGYVGADERALYVVRADAAPQRLAFEARSDAATRRLAPDLGAVFDHEGEHASLQRAGDRPVPVLAGHEVAFASWSADGSRIAAVVTSREKSVADLVVLDARGTELHRRELHEPGNNAVAWVGDTIAMISEGQVPVGLSCFAVRDDGIAEPADGRIDLPLGTGATVRQGGANGDLLLLTTRTIRDVGMLALDDEIPEVDPLSSDLLANNRLPVWIDDDHVAYVSDRFGEETVMIDERGGKRARPDARFEGDTIACAVAGTAMLCVVEDAEGHGSIVRVDDERPARRLGPAPGLQAIECADASTCIGLVEPEEGAVEIHGIDPERGTLTRRFACPRDLQCVPERVAISRDGRSLLLVDGKRVHRIDAVTGSEVAPPFVAVDGVASVQSATELQGGDLVVTDIVDREDSSLYRVVRFHEGEPRVLSQSESQWVVRPRSSPDGRHLALTTMAFHLEAVIAKNPCGI